MDTRIGYPNENLAGDSDENISSPQYATAVGLLMKGLKRIDKQKARLAEINRLATQEPEVVSNSKDDEVPEPEAPKTSKGPKRSMFDKWGDKFRDFLDNAE